VWGESDSAAENDGNFSTAGNNNQWAHNLAKGQPEKENPMAVPGIG
jgi:hypothetical protein